MTKRKRVTASRPPIHDRTQGVNVMFADLIIGSVDKPIDLGSCVPYTEIRPLSSSGVRRLISLFIGNEKKCMDAQGPDSGTTGLALGTDMPMVVELSGSSLSYVENYFRKKGMSDAQLEEKLKSRPSWYGIVDGLHSHVALTYIVENFNSWKGFKWYVKILNGGFDVHKYRKLARVQNSRHNPSYYVELTLFDVLYNLRLEHEKLKRENLKCGGAETAHSYDGVHHAKSSTLQQKANIAIRLSMPVLVELGKIMNQDHPEIMLSSKKMNRNGAQTVEQMMETADCRLYKKFLNISTLKGSAAFMNLKGHDSDEIQICTLHRVKDLYLESSFSTIVPDNLTTQLKFAKLAHKEEQKFMKFLESDSWPSEMQDIRNNMLRTVVLNKELEENSNNEFEILPKLLECYRRHFPHQAALKEAKWKSTTELQITAEEPADSNSNESTTEPEPSSIEVETTAPEPAKQINEDADLEEKHIYTFNMSWKDYLTNERNETSPRFDFLITRPPLVSGKSFIRGLRPPNSGDEIEESEVDGFCKFMKRTLKSGSYIALLIHFTSFKHWFESLEAHGMTVMPDEYIISFDLNAMKRKKVSWFTQSAHETVLVARLPGSHPTGFEPSFRKNNDEDSGDQDARFSIMLNAPTVQSMLTKPGSKIPFDNRELHPAVFEHFIKLFTPEGGSVIEPFGRTFSVGIACVRTNRSCHLLEKAKECYQAALIRLRDAAKPLPSTDFVSKATYHQPESLQLERTQTEEENADGDIDMDASHSARLEEQEQESTSTHILTVELASQQDDSSRVTDEEENETSFEERFEGSHYKRRLISSFNGNNNHSSNNRSENTDSECTKLNSLSKYSSASCDKPS